MKGYRFYKEIDTGNVYALMLDENNQPIPDTYPDEYTAIIPTSDKPNAPCAGGSVSNFILGTECVRIREDQARKQHPRMFAYLDGSLATECFDCGRVYDPSVGHECD